MSFEHLSRQELIELLDELLTQKVAHEHSHQGTINEQASLLHTLRVHQVELEMQNRELRDAQIELEESRDRYVELYDFAPVAYVTLDSDFKVCALNLTAASLLSEQRARVIDRSFVELAFAGNIAPLSDLLERCEPWRTQTAELVLEVKHKHIPVQLIASASAERGSPERRYRCALLDISQRRQAEAERDRASAAEHSLLRRFEALDRINLALSTILATNERASVPMLLEAAVEHIRVTMEAAGTTVALAADDDRPGFTARARSPDVHLESRYEVRTSMRLGSRHVGDIVVQYSQEPPDDARSTLRLLAERLALALENARLNQVEAVERARLELIECSTSELSEGTDIRTVRPAIAAAVRCAVPVFAKCFAFYAFDSALPKLVASHHHTPSQQRRWQKLAAYMALRWSKEPARLAEVTTDVARSIPRTTSETMGRTGETLGIQRLVLLPLPGRNGPFGFLCFGCEDFPSSSMAVAQRTLEDLGRRCAGVVDQAILLEELRHAVESRDTLLALVSHDLRSPLNAITLTAGSMTSEGGQRRAGPDLKLIQRSAEHMSLLIEDLVTATSIDAGQFSITPVSIDPTRLARDASAMAEPLVQARQLRLALEVESNLPSVQADPLRIQQVFSNLIGNAAKFTPRGGVLRITAKKSNVGVCFGVSDSGPGIPAGVLPFIFRRYWTTGAAHRSSSLGLGLFIAERIIEAHGGHIWAESVQGEGASFFFTLPAASSEETPAKIASQN